MKFQQLPGDGSRRVFWRITLCCRDAGFVVMASGPADEVAVLENFAYLMIGNHLLSKGIPVPRIYRHDLENGWFIMEDLGEKNLQDIVSSGQDPLPVYEDVLDILFRMQTEGAEGFDTGWCCQTPKYDRSVMRRYEADYFTGAFLCRYLGLKEEWPELEGPFGHLAEKASRSEAGFFMHRDFQSRNIMVSDGRLGIIDWQGARLGPLGYDLASLLIDPYTSLSPRQKDKAYQVYLTLVKAAHPGWAGALERSFPYLAIQRALQILGAFAHLTKAMNKPHFKSYIPGALIILDELLHQVKDPELSSLRDLARDLVSMKKSLDRPDSQKLR